MKGEILVVDDNPVNSKLVCDLLTIDGYSVLSAGSAAEVMGLLPHSTPDLILMDIGLPDIDGLALTRLLKADPSTRHIPIVALTAFAMKTDEQRARDAGCDGYMSKPINTRTFAAQIGAFLHL